MGVEAAFEMPVDATSILDGSVLDWLFLLILGAERHNNLLELSSIACGLRLKAQFTWAGRLVKIWFLFVVFGD